MISLEYLAFAQIITVLHENVQNYLRLGMGGGGGGGERGVRLCCFHMVIPVGKQVRQRRLYCNLALYEKWDDYMQTRLNAGFLTSGTTGDFID